MTRAPLSRQTVEAALEALGKCARQDGRVIDIAIYGGSALMLVSNFRASTFDVDAVADDAQQAHLERYAATVAVELGLAPRWLNDQVFPHLSDKIDGFETEHTLFRSYPVGATPGLRVFVPSAEYMCALKLIALRIEGTGAKDYEDLAHLTTVLDLRTAADALALVSRFYSRGEISGRVENGIKRLYSLFDERGAERVPTPTYLGRSRTPR